MSDTEFAWIDPPQGGGGDAGFESYDTELASDTTTINDSSISVESIVYLNGVNLCATEFTATAGIVVLNDTAYTGDNIQIFTLTADEYEDFEVTVDEDTDSITDVSIDTDVIVTLNGVSLSSAEFTVDADTNTITFTETLYDGDTVQVFSFGEAA